MAGDPGGLHRREGEPTIGSGADGSSFAAGVRAPAGALGFDLVGITTSDPNAQLDAYRAWLAGGRHGEMGYPARPDAVERRDDLHGTLDGVHKVVAAAEVNLVLIARVLPLDVRRRFGALGATRSCVTAH